jgi:MFS family permease
LLKINIFAKRSLLINFILIDRGVFMKFQDIIEPYSKLPRSVYFIFIARVVNCIGNFVFPFLTLLLTVKVGMDEKQAGYILFICAAVQGPGVLLGGKLADHIGRKKVMVIFMSLAAACLVVCGFIANLSYVPQLLILSNFFSSLVGPASGAMINDLTVSKNRQAAFSLIYLGINLGTAIGSIVAGYLFYNHIKLLFLGDAATTFIAVFLLAVFVNETKPSAKQIKEGFKMDGAERAEEGGLISALFKRPELIMFALVSAIYSFVYVQSHFSLPIQTKEIFGPIEGPRLLGMLNTINCLVVITMTTLITALTKKIRDIFKVSLAGIFFALGFGMLYFAKGYFVFAFSTIIWTIGEILNAISSSVYLANRTPISHRGRFNSFILLVSGMGQAVGPMIAGQLISRTSVENIWPISFMLAVGSAILMFLLGKFERVQHFKDETVKY